MEKGDWKLILLIVLVLIVIGILVINIDKLFPTPAIKEVLNQTINAT